MSTLAADYKTLFETLHRIVEQRPDQVPQLLALILSGGPFRPALEKPEVMNKIVIMAKNYVSKKNSDAASSPAALADAAIKRASASASAAKPKPMSNTPSRSVSARSLQPPSNITKA